MDLTINKTSFNAGKYSSLYKKGIRSTMLKSSAAADGFTLVNQAESALNKGISKAQMTEEQNIKAEKIKKVIRKYITENKTLKINTLAKITNIPINQVVTLIYRNSYPEIKPMFDQVKDKSRLEKPVNEYYTNLAEIITDEASEYKTSPSDEIVSAEDDYKMFLAKALHKAKITRAWNSESINAFAEHFKEAPAFADLLITTKNGKGSIRRISAPEIINLWFETNRINPELAESLVAELDDNGMFRFTAKAANKIVKINEKFPELLELAKSDPCTVYSLFVLKDNNGNNRFWGKELEQIYDYLKKYPDITKKLINEFEIVERFDDDNEESLSKTNSEIKIDPSDDKDNAKRQFLRYPKYSASQILKMLSHYETDPKLVEYLNSAKVGKHKLSAGFIECVLDEKARYTASKEQWFWRNYLTYDKENVFTNDSELYSLYGIKVKRRKFKF